MRRAAVLAALLALVEGGCGGHGRLAGTIVFQSDRSGGEALYAIRPDGTGLSRLPVHLPGQGADVFWTRDGTKALVMYVTGTGRSVTYVFESATREQRRIRLPEPDRISEMPWSPDGKRLVLSTNDGDVVLDVESGRSRPLQDHLADDLLTWSPDGKRLLFSSGPDLYTVPADGGPPTRLTTLARDEPGGLQWSSDGRWISFFDQGLYVVRSDGTRLRLIDRTTEEAAWSPDAERLVFPSRSGLVVVDVASGRRRQLTRDRLDDDPERLAWSPDGERILYLRHDLGFGAAQAFHDQLWTVSSDGTDKRPVTRAFPDDGTISNASAQWVDASLQGAPAPPLPYVTLRATRAIHTRLPIVALGAAGERAAVAQGFGRLAQGPLGPIVIWNPLRRPALRVPVHGCGSVDNVLLVANRIAYRCDNSGEGYLIDASLRLGTDDLVRTHGEEFSGTFLGGIAADRGTIAFDVESVGTKGRREFRIGRGRVWKSSGGRRELVRTFPGGATVASVDAGRIAVLRSEHAVSVLSPGGGARTFTFRRGRVLGAAIDGGRLLVLQSARLVVLDVASGRRSGSWPLRRGFGPAPVLEDAQGDLAAYVVGVAVHVIRLSDGREIVVDAPDATGPVFARFVPGGLFYSYNESYAARPGRLVFVARSQLERAVASRHRDRRKRKRRL